MTSSILEESKKAKGNGLLGLFRGKKLIIIILVVIAAAVGGYFLFFNKTTVTETVAAPKNWTVKKGDIQMSIASDGKVVADDSVSLSFQTSTDNAEVSKVYVKEGATIKKGDKIATVNSDTAQFELRSATANYKSALASYNKQMDEPTDLEIKKSENSVSQAEMALEQAQMSLEAAKMNSEKSFKNAENAVITAQNNLKLSADGDVSRIIDNAYQSLLGSLRSTQVAVENILRESDAILGIDDEDINDDFELLLGVKNSSTLSDATNSYNQVKNYKKEFDDALTALTDETDYQAIEKLAELDKTMLAALRDHLTAMQAMLEATITSADFNQTTLDGYKSKIGSNRSSAISTLSSLNNSLEAAMTAADNLESYQMNYDKAVSDLEYAKLQAEQDLINAEFSIKSKTVALEEARLTHEDLIAPKTESDLASLKAQLTSAEISLDKAQYNVQKATLKSPIDGVVSQLNYKAGDIITSDNAEPMAIILNTKTLYIEVNIEEADINKLKVGQKAYATFDAIDGVQIDGEITFISLTSESDNNGIVTYLVRVVFENTGEDQIREGMTAAVKFIISEAKDVLIAPVAAVRNVSGKPSVRLASGEWAAVTTGYTNGTEVEVISGVKEGDKITY
jgi:RND family efflux transporter MFP subunit